MVECADRRCLLFHHFIYQNQHPQMNTQTDSKIEHICHCSGTTSSQIIKLLNQGYSSLEEITRMTGAGAGCGGCEQRLCDLLAGELPSHSDNFSPNL
jgi:bacterioferritin-associated ferredoxin